MIAQSTGARTTCDFYEPRIPCLRRRPRRQHWCVRQSSAHGEAQMQRGRPRKPRHERPAGPGGATTSSWAPTAARDDDAGSPGLCPTDTATTLPSWATPLQMAPRSSTIDCYLITMGALGPGQGRCAGYEDCTPGWGDTASRPATSKSRSDHTRSLQPHPGRRPSGEPLQAARRTMAPETPTRRALDLVAIDWRTWRVL